MVFEYDSNKSDTNLQKHGIDFDRAQALWQDDNLLEVPLRYPHEARFLCVGRIGLKHWSAIVTYREGATRIISVRRSREEEINHYENNR
ncbi:MAG: BrnT family toxin [Campylobacterales bacterium]